MKIADCITVTMDELTKGCLFTYADFKLEVNKKEVAIKTIISRQNLPPLGHYYKD
jgi:hypothetical protein